VTSVVALSIFALIDVYCLLEAHRLRRLRLRPPPRPRLASDDTDLTPLLKARLSMSGSYYDRRKRSTSLGAEGTDIPSTVVFRLQLVLVCEAINLVFQILGEAGAFLGQRSFFFLPFLFGVLLEQGQPILLFLAFGLEEPFFGSVARRIARFGAQGSLATFASEDDDMATKAEETGPPVSYDDLLDVYVELMPLVRTVGEYRNCFLGTEAIDRMLLGGKVPSRAHGVAVGRQLMAYHLIAHVRLEHGFEDRPLAYRLVEPLDEDQPVSALDQSLRDDDT